MANKNLKIFERGFAHFEVKDGLVYLWFGSTEALIMKPQKALQVGQELIQASIDAGNENRRNMHHGK